MNKAKRYFTVIFIVLFIVFFAVPVFASVGAESMMLFYEKIRSSSRSWVNTISDYTLILLATTTLIGFAIGCKDLSLGGSLSLEGIVSLLVRFAFLSGTMIWLIKDPSKLMAIPKSLAAMGKEISGQEASLDNTMMAFAKMVEPIANYYATLGWTQIGEAILCMVLVFIINCVGLLFSTTLLCVQIETVFILVGGMFTAAFFVIGYFRDVFMGYIKALAMNGLKLLLLSLCMGFMLEIVDSWVTELNTGMAQANGLFDTATPMVCGLIAFYVIVKSVPQYAVAILTGSATADAGYIKSAVAAGVGAGQTVWNTTSKSVQSAFSSGSMVKNAAQAYMNTVQAVRDTGGNSAVMQGIGAALTSTDGHSKADRIYKDYYRTKEFEGVRTGNSGSSMSPGYGGSAAASGAQQGAGINPAAAQKSYVDEMLGRSSPSTVGKG